jgi:ferredoxin
MPVALAEVEDAVRARGLAPRGAFHPAAEDDVPLLADGRPAATVVLAGQIGDSLWERFTAERRDELEPLDGWSERALADVAARFGAAVLLPSQGPPRLPFQRWAQRAEPVHRSPLGLLIHPEYGLWHAYRGALAFAERLELPPGAPRPSPCESCAGRPCLRACPVDAFRAAGFDPAACTAHLGSGRGDVCFAAGCLARAACPIGRLRYPPEQARFHLVAFLRGSG